MNAEGTLTGKTLQARFSRDLNMCLTERYVCIWNF